MTWKPIETAPRDGTRVLLATESGYIGLAGWNSTDEIWRSSMYGYVRDPKHWQPLPAPPVEPEDGR